MVLGFTRSPLSALIAAIVVPCTISITFAVMSAIGMTFNMMTLGGLAAGIGLFIDDAIVMIEAMHRAHAGGAGAQAAVQSALAELTRPLIASTATVIVVFLPLIFLSGVTGVFFRALAFTLGSGLAVSLVLALYFTPALEVLVERWRRLRTRRGIPARTGPALLCIQPQTVYAPPRFGRDRGRGFARRSRDAVPQYRQRLSPATSTRALSRLTTPPRRKVRLTILRRCSPGLKTC